MYKALWTDIVSILLIGAGMWLPEPYAKAFLYTGIFAFSGAVTNHLAVHMLFERIPFLYGSGVIERNFERFKEAIKSMLMEQFFSPTQLERFFMEEEAKIDFAPIVQKMDFSPAYDALVRSVMESKFGGAVAMFGGESALEELRAPFTEKMRNALVRIVSSETFKTQLSEGVASEEIGKDLADKIESVIDKRLEELTPTAVKALMQKLIREHLGWLVVWGGVFGGLIGLIGTLIL